MPFCLKTVRICSSIIVSTFFCSAVSSDARKRILLHVIKIINYKLRIAGGQVPVIPGLSDFAENGFDFPAESAEVVAFGSRV